MEAHVGAHHFEAVAEAGRPVEYVISRFEHGCEEPCSAVTVSREDFLAMLELAKCEGSVAR